jgi:predicted phosphodiesterase
MKVGIVSDLHLEFGYLHLYNTNDIDVLILAGDICHIENSYIDFFEEISGEFPLILYVLGNHEYYE